MRVVVRHLVLVVRMREMDYVDQSLYRDRRIRLCVSNCLKRLRRDVVNWLCLPHSAVCCPFPEIPEVSNGIWADIKTECKAWAQELLFVNPL